MVVMLDMEGFPFGRMGQRLLDKKSRFRRSGNRSARMERKRETNVIDLRRQSNVLLLVRALENSFLLLFV
jgi:hypothetical protein